MAFACNRLVMNDHLSQGAFTKLAKWIANKSGSPVAFLGSICVVLIWAISGPIFGFNDTWQLVINTGTTIVTFLMVFLIQNTQNRDTAALQLKLDELIRVHKEANNILLEMEELDQSELDTIRDRYEHLAEESRRSQGNKSISRIGKDNESRRGFNDAGETVRVVRQNPETRS
jgi:low affinity Fe/Cu permease